MSRTILYATIHPTLVPAEARAAVLDMAEHQARLLGLAQRPAVVFFDERARVPADRLCAWGWKSHLIEEDVPVRGLFFHGRPFGGALRPEIHIRARGTLANILNTVAHECRHVWQAVIGGSEHISGRWVDVRDPAGAEPDAYGYAARQSVPAWTHNHIVTPVYG